VVTSICHSSLSSKTAVTPSTGYTSRCPHTVHFSVFKIKTSLIEKCSVVKIKCYKYIHTLFTNKSEEQTGYGMETV